ncbi:MAG: amidohydrolase family protein [Clostridia bacterium]|nr:amidohydrolase family protein [Clostridia bacterium]
MKKIFPINRYDYHVHIGQFQNVYYNPYKIVNVLSYYGVAGAYISSTTSCMNWDSVEEKNIIVEHIKAEFDELLLCSTDKNFDARPLCWVIPQRYYEGDSVEQMYSESEYQGFKIHPRAHIWNIDDKKIHILLDDICQIAENKNVPIIIHTGICDFEKPSKFEHWFKKFPKVNFVLAHCKAVDEMMALFTKYSNVFGDVAFSSPSDLQKIINTNYFNRLLFGTDFPITTYKENMEFYEDRDLYENYKLIMYEWNKYTYKFNGSFV